MAVAAKGDVQGRAGGGDVEVVVLPSVVADTAVVRPSHGLHLAVRGAPVHLDLVVLLCRHAVETGPVVGNVWVQREVQTVVLVRCGRHANRAVASRLVGMHNDLHKILTAAGVAGRSFVSVLEAGVVVDVRDGCVWVEQRFVVLGLGGADPALEVLRDAPTALVVVLLEFLKVTADEDVAAERVRGVLRAGGPEALRVVLARALRRVAARCFDTLSLRLAVRRGPHTLGVGVARRLRKGHALLVAAAVAVRVGVGRVPHAQARQFDALARRLVAGLVFGQVVLGVAVAALAPTLCVVLAFAVLVARLLGAVHRAGVVLAAQWVHVGVGHAARVQRAVGGVRALRQPHAGGDGEGLADAVALADVAVVPGLAQVRDHVQLVDLLLVVDARALALDVGHSGGEVLDVGGDADANQRNVVDDRAPVDVLLHVPGVGAVRVDEHEHTAARDLGGGFFRHL
eukprot:PhM_4_TR14616/c4_g1_i1/m.84435